MAGLKGFRSADYWVETMADCWAIHWVGCWETQMDFLTDVMMDSQKARHEHEL
jgi:hypothetical protein